MGNYEADITRGEFVRLAMNYLRVKLNMINAQIVAAYATHPNRIFTDTTCPDIQTAGKLGITSGVSGVEPNRQFGDGPFDREMAAFMLVQVHRILRYDINDFIDHQYNDMHQVRWHPNAVNFVITHDVMRGTNPTGKIFSPLTNFTRQQSILTFDRIYYAPPLPLYELNGWIYGVLDNGMLNIEGFGTVPADTQFLPGQLIFEDGRIYNTESVVTWSGRETHWYNPILFGEWVQFDTKWLETLDEPDIEEENLEWMVKHADRMLEELMEFFGTKLINYNRIYINVWPRGVQHPHFANAMPDAFAGIDEIWFIEERIVDKVRQTNEKTACGVMLHELSHTQEGRIVWGAWNAEWQEVSANHGVDYATHKMSDISFFDISSGLRFHIPVPITGEEHRRLRFEAAVWAFTGGGLETIHERELLRGAAEACAQWLPEIVDWDVFKRVHRRYLDPNDSRAVYARPSHGWNPVSNQWELGPMDKIVGEWLARVAIEDGRGAELFSLFPNGGYWIAKLFPEALK